MTIERKDAKFAHQLDAELAVQRDETISDQDFLRQRRPVPPADRRRLR
jgi:hypothetical protein